MCVCVQKNALSNPSFCSQGKARSATRKAWEESKFDRVAKTLFPIDSRGRAADFLGACVALPAAKRVSWWSAINVTQQTIQPLYIFLYQYFSCTQCCWLAGARGGVTLWTKASTDEPTITHTWINTWKLHTGSKGRKQMHNLLVLRLQHQQGDQYNNTNSPPQKTFPAFLAVVGLVWAQP